MLQLQPLLRGCNVRHNLAYVRKAEGFGVNGGDWNALWSDQLESAHRLRGEAMKGADLTPQKLNQSVPHLLLPS